VNIPPADRQESGRWLNNRSRAHTCPSDDASGRWPASAA
jgi:hypothetical protein